MMPETTIHILRSSSENGSQPLFVTFRVPCEENMTVLAALLWIQDNLDGTVAFRYSCRGAVCGSCAMVINGSIDLACRTHLSDLPPEITLEPLPNMPILKDLVVDMTSFWEGWAKVKPYLIRAEMPAEGEIRQSPQERERIEQFINCILCAACYAACPIKRGNADYVGPAALAALDRFVEDSRDQRGMNGIKPVGDSNGLWGCRTAFRCNDVCPKEVRPADGIADLRTRALKGLFMRRSK
jgi:succinate dehydrogenase / fumarate reductase iron-sulfur subunit